MATVLRRTAAASPTAHTRPARTAEAAVLRVGFWSAVLTAIFYIGWLIGAVIGFFLPPAWALVAMSAPSLFIPLSWIPLMLCIRRWAPDDRKIYGDISAAFAVMYGALLPMNYFVALTVTAPKALAGIDTGVLTTAPQGVFNAIEATGYSLMSLSALFAGLVFTGGGLLRWIRWLLVITGFFAVVLPWQMLWSTFPSPPLLASVPREFTLTAAVILLAVLFRRGERPNTDRRAPTMADVAPL